MLKASSIYRQQKHHILHLFGTYVRNLVCLCLGKSCKHSFYPHTTTILLPHLFLTKWITRGKYITKCTQTLMASFPRRLHAIQGNFQMFLLRLVRIELCFIRQMGPELAVATEANNEVNWQKANMWRRWRNAPLAFPKIKRVDDVDRMGWDSWLTPNLLSSETQYLSSQAARLKSFPHNNDLRSV